MSLNINPKDFDEVLRIYHIYLSLTSLIDIGYVISFLKLHFFNSVSGIIFKGKLYNHIVDRFIKYFIFYIFFSKD